MPEDMPDKMPEGMSDRMPEDLPVTKCINVMVVITRSKVFFSVDHFFTQGRFKHPNILFLYYARTVLYCGLTASEFPEMLENWVQLLLEATITTLQ